MTWIETAMQWAGTALVLTGAFLVFTAAFGINRMPSFFTRLHPAGIADALGAPSLLIGLMLLSGFTPFSFKLLLLLIFLLFTCPTACHALAKAAFVSGIADNEIPKEEMFLDESDPNHPSQKTVEKDV